MVLCYDSPEKLLHTPRNENKEQWALATPRVILRTADPVPLGNTVGPKPVLLAQSLLFTNPSRWLTHTFNFEKHSYREVGLQIGWTIHSTDIYYRSILICSSEKKNGQKYCHRAPLKCCFRRNGGSRRPIGRGGTHVARQKVNVFTSNNQKYT